MVREIAVRKQIGDFTLVVLLLDHDILHGDFWRATFAGVWHPVWFTSSTEAARAAKPWVKEMLQKALDEVSGQ